MTFAIYMLQIYLEVRRDHKFHSYIIWWRTVFWLSGSFVFWRRVLLWIRRSMVVFIVVFSIPTIVISPSNLKMVANCLALNLINFMHSYPCSEPVVFALLISRDVVLGVTSIPSELIFFVCWNIHILKVTVWLLSVAKRPRRVLWEWQADWDVYQHEEQETL